MKKTVYWITSTYASKFDSLKVIKEEKNFPEEEGHLEGCLWFDNENDADKLLYEIKKTIKNFYSSRKNPKCPVK